MFSLDPPVERVNETHSFKTGEFLVRTIACFYIIIKSFGVFLATKLATGIHDSRRAGGYAKAYGIGK